MVAYTLKDDGKEHYFNVRGGSDWDDAKVAEWVEAYNERNVGQGAMAEPEPRLRFSCSV